jgi:hypothetical protein
MFIRYRSVSLFFFVAVLLCEVALLVLASDGISSNYAQATRENAARPAIVVTPREIDFGNIGPSEGTKSIFVIKKSTGAGNVEWSVNGPEGWSPMEVQKLAGTLLDKPENLRIHISSLKEDLHDGTGNVRNSYPVQMTLEANNRFVSYRNRLTAGAHREMLKLVSGSGTSAIFVRFKLVSAEAEPIIHVEPSRVDFGIVKPGDQLSRRVKVTNGGTSTLKWNISVKSDSKAGMTAKPGRYISFLNEDVAGSGLYVPPSNGKDVMDISGKWSEINGYPSIRAAHHVLKYRFLGTGISVFFSVEPDGGDMTAYIDEKKQRDNNQDCRAGRKERAECVVAEGLANGQHTLTIVGREGTQAMIEGVRIYGKDVMKGNPGWISIFPDSGTTNRETDFVNITVNAHQSNLGYYGENLLFESNGGQSIVEVSLEVSGDNIPKILDVYRYVQGADYLYTSNPQEDAKVIYARGYRKQGISFRLFSPGAPGTTAFYRWYHPGKKIHFYSYDRQGEGKSLKGYIFEGTIGHIGTSRLTNTRALYRWFNPVSGGHFYTTDPSGEGHLKKKYRFDGIAGYVR